MSCNGCRVLRKGCSESCVLRPCLEWIDGAEAQGQATVFVAKFFGRAGLMSFISAVPESQRPAVFQSLLFEACGRTVNPVSGAVGLLWTGNWDVCRAAVETVLHGGMPGPCPELGVPVAGEQGEEGGQVPFSRSGRAVPRRSSSGGSLKPAAADLDLSLTPTSPPYAPPERRLGRTPPMCAEESGMSAVWDGGAGELLNLFT